MKRVSQYVQQLFYSLGWQVADHPYFFICMSTTVSLLLMATVKNMPYHADQQYYVSPYGTASRHDEEVHDYFNSLQYKCIADFTNPNKTLQTGKLMVDRVANLNNVLSIIIKPKDGGSVLRKDIFDEVGYIHDAVLKTRAKSFGKSWSYEDLCMETHARCLMRDEDDALMCQGKTAANTKLSKCMYMDISPILDNIEKIESADVTVTWPILGFEDHVDNVLYGPVLFGGANATVDGVLHSSAAFRLMYVLNDEDAIISKVINDWSTIIISTLDTIIASNLSLTDMSYISHDAHNAAEFEFLIIVMKAAAITGVVLVIFASASSVTGDWVTSKIWLGVVAVLIVLCGTVSAFAILGLLGMPFTVYMPVVGLLILGIGLDDSFVLLNAWVVTPRRDCVQRRLAEVYAEAGASIATTSLTNMIGFSIAAFIPVRYFVVFGVCSALAILLLYVYTLTFFGAFLALMGRAEEQQRNCVTFRKMDSEDFAFKTGTNKPDPLKAHPMGFLYTIQNLPWCQWWASLVCNRFSKFYIGALYLAYLSGAAYFASQSQVLITPESVMRTANPVAVYMRDNTEYFLQSPERYEVLVMGRQDYSDPVVQEDLLSLLQRAETEGHFQESLYTDSWLRAYISFVSVTKEMLDLNITGEENFNYNLKDVCMKLWYFFAGKDSVLASDVRFDEDGHIVASRFMLQPKPFKGLGGYYDLMKYMRNLTASPPYDSYNIRIHSPGNVFSAETYGVMKTQLLPSVLTTCLVMCCVGFLLIPKKEYAVYVALSLASIEIGILGYLKAMGLDVTLGIFNTLIISFGFSIDSVAHICFAFAKADCDPADEKSEVCQACQTKEETNAPDSMDCVAPSSVRLTRALRKVMRAIITGVSSTIISVLPLAFVGCETIVPFVWGVVLTMALSVLHGFVFLPAVLVAANSRSLGNVETNQGSESNTLRGILAVLSMEAEAARGRPHRNSVISISNVELKSTAAFSAMQNNKRESSTNLVS